MVARIRITVAVESDRYSYRNPSVERDVELSASLFTDPVVMNAVAGSVVSMAKDALAEHAVKQAALDEAKAARDAISESKDIVAADDPADALAIPA